MRRPALMLLALASAGLLACGGGDGPTGSGNGGGSGGGGGGGGSTSNSVRVNDNSFTPAATTVPRGTTVTWTWAGSNPHNVTFGTGTENSATQSSGTFARTFAAAGTYDYRCTVHGASMSGTVTVQ